MLFVSHFRFDEIHFGRFTTFFLRETFFFDINPPFAKLVFALIGTVLRVVNLLKWFIMSTKLSYIIHYELHVDYLCGLDSSYNFENIGQGIAHHIIHYCM